MSASLKYAHANDLVEKSGQPGLDLFLLITRMAIANGTSVSFCNQPKAHFGLPWVRCWDNHGKCHMDVKRIQCLSNASQHAPIYLQPFPSNSTRKFKSSPF